MCGIAGWVDWGAEIKRRQTIEQMTGTLAHRGPDDAGIWLSDHAALGHRRLSVIDPAGGQQPMIRRQGNRLYIISYNGELYNTRELRAKLTARGHVFKTRCREELLAPELAEYIRSADYINQRYRETLEEVPRLNGESNEEARQRETSYLTLVWFMATLLDRKDRMSMASGLEIRVPFCDHRLVEYAWNIPWQMKQYGGIEKGILRHTLRGLLDNDVLYRKKSPYPKTHHPGYLQAVREIFNQIILDSSSPLKPLLNQQKARKLAQMEKDNFNHPWFGQLMTGPQLMAYLIQVNLWLQKYNVTVL